MTLHWKLVIDATDAPRLADFWAAALEYRVEDPSLLIAQLLDTGRLPEQAVHTHNGKLTFRGYAAIRHPGDQHDQLSGTGHGRRILFQTVPEAKTVKNRLHIDIHHPADSTLAALADRLETLGATRVREMDNGQAGRWWVMCDPEGNEFCAS